MVAVVAGGPEEAMLHLRRMAGVRARPATGSDAAIGSDIPTGFDLVLHIRRLAGLMITVVCVVPCTGRVPDQEEGIRAELATIRP